MEGKLRQLRLAGYAEAMSYLALLGVAMPLKYVYGLPDGVRYVGAVHGALFVLYVVLVLRAARAAAWTTEDRLEALAASILPLGPFLLHPGAETPTPASPPPS